MSDKPLRVSDWEFLTEKVTHRVEPWHRLFLASAGRLELTNSCLCSLPLLRMIIYMIFDVNHMCFDKVRSRLFWEGVGHSRKYNMVDWATVCRSKDFGGLGILNTRLMKIALMLNCVWNLYQNAECLWVDLLRAKYLGDEDVFPPPSRGKARNSGPLSKRSSGISRWELNTRSVMGSALTSGWTGGRAPLPCGSVTLTFSTDVPCHFYRSTRTGMGMGGGFSSVDSLALLRRLNGTA
jgi:hypothetical protein